MLTFYVKTKLKITSERTSFHSNVQTHKYGHQNQHNGHQETDHESRDILMRQTDQWLKSLCCRMWGGVGWGGDEAGRTESQSS